MTKSCRKKHPHISVTIFCTLIIIILMIKFVASQSLNYKEMEILDDLPLKLDLNKFMKSLEKAVNFMNKNIHYVDLNVCLGIFLANVQLEYTIKSKNNLPTEEIYRLEHLIKLTNSIVANFTREVVMNDKNNSESAIKITGLFITNNIKWRHQLPEYSIHLLKKTKFYTRKDMEKRYLRWLIYNKFVYGDESRKDSSKSDYCLSLLAQNPINQYNTGLRCQIPYKCFQFVFNGTNYGYGLTHRALFLLLARLERGCLLLSANYDKLMLESICVNLYTEAEFIASHGFQTSDLITEIIAICSLDGHAQFLRRSWIYELLNFQTELGCFNVTRTESNFLIPEVVDVTKYPRKLFLDDQMILWGSCNTHTTSVAITMLASAIRYVVDNYY